MTNTSPIVKTIHGSHLYGLDTPDSDIDYKGIFLPSSAHEIVLGKSPKHLRNTTGNNDSRNGKEDVDMEMFSLHTFIEMCLKGEMIAIDLLHTPEEFIVEKGENFEIFEFIQMCRKSFYSKDMTAYLGYIRKQISKYGLKGTRLGAVDDVLATLEPFFKDEKNIGNLSVISVDALPINEFCKWVKHETAIGTQFFYEVIGKKFQDKSKAFEMYLALKKVKEKYGHRAIQAKNNEGVDWKAVSHAARAAYQLISIYEKGGIIFPLPEKDILIDIKLGRMDFETEVSPLITELTDRVEKLALASEYPEKPSRERWEKFVGDVYCTVVEEEVNSV